MVQKKNKATDNESAAGEKVTPAATKRKKSITPEAAVQAPQSDAAVETKADKKPKTAKTATKKTSDKKTTEKAKAPRKPSTRAKKEVKAPDNIAAPVSAPKIEEPIVPVISEEKKLSPVSQKLQEPSAPQVKHEVKQPAVPSPKPVETVPQPAAPAAQVKPQPPAAVPLVSKGTITINELTTVRDLAEKMTQRPGDIIKKLLTMGSLATINQRLDIDTATLLAHEFGYEVKQAPIYAEVELIEEKEDASKLKHRPPVVTIMGHVDHGKTSLLDAVRKSRIVDAEAGGITQHIGAYKVKTPKGEIAFLDTPGHEAFTAMRSRGAKATDIVVLVVSATDGVMPQTVEAIDHARAANVPIIVAVNKIDLPTANPQGVKQALSKYNLVPEEWGGDTIMVDVSARNNINIDQLLEMILLKAEMMELKANPGRDARGVVIEAKLDTRRGPVATVLIQNGTLHVGDNFVVGSTNGKIRAMIDEHGHRLIEAAPSTPVEILGITMPPQAGDQFIVVADERQARAIASSRQIRAREDSLKPRHHLTLEDISSGKVKELRLVLKTDVQGSLGALQDSLERLSTHEINLKIIHSGAGSITESDVTLAAASDALIIGFNLRPDSSVERLAEREGVSIRIYRIIYDAIADVRAAMEGLLEPELKETIIGKAQVRQVFKLSKSGIVAGSIVTEGKAIRGSKVRLVRNNIIVFEGTVSSLKRFKEDVKEVEKGYECGISLENFSDYKPGDTFEFFSQEKIARKLA